MELHVAVSLIQGAFSSTQVSETWADLGSGSGLFAQALAEILAPNSTILAIDKDPSSLNAIQWNVPDISLVRMSGDFTNPSLALPRLDGLLMANALHFVNDQVALLASFRKNLTPEGKFILVEYDMDVPNAWVPYPVSFETLTKKIAGTGFHSIQKIGETKSVYNRAMIYAALLQ